MKATHVILGAAIAIASLSTNLMAQGNGQGNGRGNGPGNGQGQGNFRDGEPREMCDRIPNLTDAQKEQMEKLRIAHIAKRTEFKNKMNELRAKKQTLTTAEKADLKAINAVIDEMTALQNAHMKANAAHKQEIRALLTADQRVLFDAHQGKGGKGKGMYGGKGKRGGACMN